MRDDLLYSRDQLINLRQYAPRLDDVMRRRALSAGLGRERSRARGRRAGKRKQSVLARSVRSADRSTILDASVASVTRPLPTARQRHVCLPPPQLNFATFNVRSLRNKVDATRDLLLDQRRPIDIICLTETWHEDTDDAPIRRLCADGFQVLERARPVAATAATNTINYTNHGGVAIVAPTRVKISKLSPKFEPQTFELLCARISSCGASCLVAVVYRPGSDSLTIRQKHSTVNSRD